MKFMNLKRFASTVMAGVMALSLAVPAFAATPPANTTTVTGSYAEIPIAVSVPTTGTAQINPYGLPISIGKSDDTTVDLVNQQITTRPLNIKNQGTVALDVNATLAVTPKGDVAIGTTADTGKTIKVDLEVVGLDDTTLAVSTENETIEDKLIDKFADEDTWASATTLAAPAVAKGATPTTPAKSASALATLGAATVSGETVTYGSDSIALFRLTGACAQAPVKADSSEDPWAAADGFTATVVFKFAPHVPAPATVTITEGATLNVANGGTGSLNVTFDAGESGLTVTSYSWASDATGVATVAAGNNASATSTTVTWVSAGTANVTCTATLSDSTTVRATCAVTCAS